MIKVLTVIGTRPEAIKLAPVVRALAARRGDVESVVCVTAQHREMLDQVLSLFGIQPDHDLDVMRERQSPTDVAASILSKLGAVLEQEKPDWVLVQGDTTTAMAAAIAAFYRRVKVGHVEAGLRTYDKWQPFPEEINRRIAGVIADLHFAPTKTARENLIRENIHERRISVTGNTVIDALHWAAAQPLPGEIRLQLTGMGLGVLLNGSASSRRIVLVTAHRRENHGDPLEQICMALRDLAERYSEDVIIYPVHPNPSIKEPVHALLGQVPNIILTPPLEYLPLIHVMKRAHLVLTDSGGLQEEAPGLGKPVLVLRETTERPEGVSAGTVKLVGTARETIVREATRLMDNPHDYDAMATAVNPYGDGQASARIVAELLSYDRGADAYDATSLTQSVGS